MTLITGPAATGRRARSPAACLTAFAADLGHVLGIFADLLAAFAADLGHVLGIFADLLAAFAADLGHVLAILTDLLAAFAAGLARLLRAELVSRTLLVGSFATLAGNLPLLLLIH